ncbi:MAG: hypothetical protein E7543_05945 [Ruminococcaceae bacterium]|nr:hypothetical protein [Oscillospiraceae bacterium]
MKNLKRITALLLSLVLFSGSLVCYAAEGEKQYYDYDKVLLLGDSEASGFTDYGDEMSEFTRVDDSYAAYVADALGAELIPMACPGFRTIELRYMLDDSYRPDDKYLFTQVPRTPKDEILLKAPALRQAIAETDIILIGIGGNDWGAYLGWVMADVQLENNLPEDFKAELRKLLANATFEDGIISKIIELADYLNALDDLAKALPEAMTYAFSNLRENWNYIIEYIYENNPDVTLMAIGMFPTYYQTPEGEPENIAQPNALKMLVEDAIIDYGNKHMLDNQEKYGYIYVDTYGTVVEISHPTVAGHRHISQRILEALPDARFTFSDVPVSSAGYKAVEYMYLNGLMAAADAVTFGAEEKMTVTELTSVLNKLNGYEVNESTAAVTALKLSSVLYKASGKTGITDFFSYLIGMLKLIVSGQGFGTVTRAEAALEIYNTLIK